MLTIANIENFRNCLGITAARLRANGADLSLTNKTAVMKTKEAIVKCLLS